MRGAPDFITSGGLVSEVAPTVLANFGEKGGLDNQHVDNGCPMFVTEVSPSVTAKWAKGSGGPSGDECQNLVPEVGPTVLASWRKGLGPVDGETNGLITDREYRVRRFTPVECERLQGFPDGWTDVDGMSKTQRYRMLGNAMSVNVMRWIGTRIERVMEAAA